MSWILKTHLSTDTFAVYQSNQRSVGRPALIYRCLITDAVRCSYICRRKKRMLDHQRSTKHSALGKGGIYITLTKFILEPGIKGDLFVQLNSAVPGKKRSKAVKKERQMVKHMIFSN